MLPRCASDFGPHAAAVVEAKHSGGRGKNGDLHAIGFVIADRIINDRKNEVAREADRPFDDTLHHAFTPFDEYPPFRPKPQRRAYRGGLGNAAPEYFRTASTMSNGKGH
jgi:hypothetical protein